MSMEDKIKKEIQDTMSKSNLIYEYYLEGQITLEQFEEQMELNHLSLMDAIELGK